MRAGFVVLICLAFATAAIACPVAVTSYAAPIVKAAVVAPVVVAPVATFVPLYGASYSGGVSKEDIKEIIREIKGQSQQNSPAGMEEILREIRKLNERMDRIEKPVNPSMPPAHDPFNPSAPVKTSALSTGLGKCLACHEQGSSTVKGGGFAMFKGDQLVTLGARDFELIRGRVQTGSMPPRYYSPKLDDAEREAIVAWAGGQSR